MFIVAKMQIVKRIKGKAQTRQDWQKKFIIIKHWECHCENTNNVGHKVKDCCCKNIKSAIIKTYTKFDKEKSLLQEHQKDRCKKKNYIRRKKRKNIVTITESTNVRTWRGTTWCYKSLKHNEISKNSHKEKIVTFINDTFFDNTTFNYNNFNH
jgi:hypothetical protein